MRQRGRPRRSSMPAVAHNKILDTPYSRQPQSPDHHQMQHYYNDEKPNVNGQIDEDSQQLSAHYSRIQLGDHWPHISQQPQFPASGSSGNVQEQQQQRFYSFDGHGQPLLTEVGPSFMQNSQLQEDFDDDEEDDEDDDDQSPEEEDDDDDDEEEELTCPSTLKRKRAFSFSSAPMASTTNTMITTSTAIAGDGTTSTAEKRPATKICRVCGDKAYSYNFNVITCESCKAFFRRNANKEKEIRCPFNEQCEINIVSRRFCQRCRLQKCFRVGMKKEWIMSDEARLEKKQRIQENRERRAAAAAVVQPTEMDQQPSMIQEPQAKEEAMSLAAATNIPMPPLTSLLSKQPQPTENNITVLMSNQLSPVHKTNQMPAELPTAAIAALPNTFVPPAAAAAAAAMNSPLLNAAATGNEQVMAVAQVAAAAAQACAVQQAVNQAAAAVLLHHHQQQQHQQQNDFVVDLQQQLQQHEPSPPSQQSQPDDSSNIPPPIVAIPVASSTSIHTTVASGGGNEQQPPTHHSAPTITEFISNVAASSAAAVESQQQQQTGYHHPMQQQQNDQGAEPLTLGATLIQPQKSLLSPTGLASSGTGQFHQIMMTTNADPSMPQHQTVASAMAPAAAVAAALIQQQQNQHHQQMVAAAPISATATITPPTTNCQIPNAAAAVAQAASIQQQIASQVSAQQQAQQIVDHHQQQQQAQAAAVAVAQFQQQQAQAAQQQAAAAHIVQMQHIVQQQQQLAALANAAVAQHQQNQTGTILAGTGPSATVPTETVNQQLQHVANALSSGSLTSSSNASPAAVTPGTVLPTFIEVAAQLAAHPPPPVQQPQQVQPAPPTAALQPNPSATAAAILPTLIPPSAAQTAASVAAANHHLLIQHHQQQQEQQQHHSLSLNNNQPATGGHPVQLSSFSSPATATSLPGAAPTLMQTGQIPLGLAQPAPPQPPTSQPHHQHHHQQEMISVPKDVLIKLVEQRLEAERNQLQTPTKCQCHCQCGRYPSDMLIVDKVMADLLEGSSKHMISNGSENQSSTNSTPRLSQHFQPANFQSINHTNQQEQQQPSLDKNIGLLAAGAAPATSIEAMDTTSHHSMAQHQLSTNDQEQLAELAKANEIWKSSAPATSNAHNNSDLQFLLGHYTDSDLRRLIQVAKALEAFKRLDQHDQERLLKGCFGSFFVLRSLLTVDISDYNLAILRQNGVSETTIRFYADFPAEWRQNETINLLLGMLLLFNVEVAGLQSAISVTVENMKFQSLLKRLLFVYCERDSTRAEMASTELMARVDQLKQLFPSPSTVNSQPSCVVNGTLIFGHSIPSSQIELGGGGTVTSS